MTGPFTPSRPPVRDNEAVRRIGRRGVLMGVVGSLLAACGIRGRSDVAAVSAALQAAVDAVPAHIDGTVQYQDTGMAGTRIDGVMIVTGQDRDAVAHDLEALLEAVIGAYRDQPRTRTATVRMEARPAADSALRVKTADVIDPAEGVTVTTEDLERHFDR